jgi:hypothetical protein
MRFISKFNRCHLLFAHLNRRCEQNLIHGFRLKTIGLTLACPLAMVQYHRPLKSTTKPGMVKSRSVYQQYSPPERLFLLAITFNYIHLRVARSLGLYLIES